MAAEVGGTDMNMNLIFRCIIAFTLVLAFSQTAFSQTEPQARLSDENGVNLLTGQIESSVWLASIGHGQGTLSHSTNTFGSKSGTSLLSYLRISGPSNGEYKYTVRLSGGAIVVYTASTDTPTNSTVFTAEKLTGSSLNYENGIYTFTGAAGSTVLFDETLGNKATEAVSPNGFTLKYHYRLVSVPAPGGGTTMANRLSSVTNSYGYQIKYHNIGASNYSMVFLNNKDEYCDPIATTCSVGSQWAEASITSPYINDTLFYDAMGREHENDRQTIPNGYVLIHKSPSGDHSSAAYQYGSLIQVERNGVVTQYNVTIDDKGTQSDLSDDEKTVTATYSDNSTRTVVSYAEDNRAISITDDINNVTTYAYNSDKRVSSVTSPSGIITSYIYDSRGNLTSTTVTPLTGAQISTSTGYPSSCTTANQKYCNKPVWTEDADGNRTDYTYSAAHGGVTRIQGVAASVGKPRPEINFTYSQHRAKAKNANGALIDLEPVWLLESKRGCTTASTCNGASEEIVTTHQYNPNQNLTLSSTTTATGDNTISNTVSYTYDIFGNTTVVDGPIPGNYDKSRSFYNANRELTGRIGGDADGNGIQKRGASKVNRNSGGIVTSTESGVTTGFGFNNFVLQQSVGLTHDGEGRLIKSELLIGGITEAVSQRSYDIRGRVECSVTRMNPNQFGSVPSSACSMGAAGVYGPDRITRTTYDTLNRPMTVTKGYASNDPITTSVEYYDWGGLKHLIDGKGNKTYYTYDGFNRKSRTYFPDPVNVGSYNNYDYEQINYNPWNGRVKSVRKRSGEIFGFAYDDRGNLFLINRPGTADDTRMWYDLSDRIYKTFNSSSVIDYTYDAFSNVTGETSNLGTVGYEYDSYGRRSRMNYPGAGGFHVTYDYDYSGKLTAIKDKTGSAVVLYSFDSLGRKKREYHSDGSGVELFYDAQSRIDKWAFDGPGSVNDNEISFAYSPAGQIISETFTQTEYLSPIEQIDTTAAVNGVNQLTDVNGDSFGYDIKGNLTTTPDDTLGYDMDNNLTSASAGTSLDYDVMDMLSSYTAGGNTTEYLYDGVNIIAEYENGAPVRRYVHGGGVNSPVAMYNGTGQSNHTAYARDVRGSVVAHFTPNGSVTQKNTYDEFGIPAANNHGLFGYTGQIYMPDLSMYHYKARVYDPKTGRFAQNDPIGYGDGLNTYNYVGSDPINGVDPLGLCVLPTFSVYGATVTIEGGPSTNLTYRRQTGWDTRGCQDEFGRMFDTSLPSTQTNNPTGPNQGLSPGQGCTPACQDITSCEYENKKVKGSNERDFGGEGYKVIDNYKTGWTGRNKPLNLKWGRYNCSTSSGSSCSFIGPGNDTIHRGDDRATDLHGIINEGGYNSLTNSTSYWPVGSQSFNLSNMGASEQRLFNWANNNNVQNISEVPNLVDFGGCE